MLCEGPPQYAPDPYKLTSNLLTLKVVSESGVTWATSLPILVFLGLSVLDLGPMYATERRQTDQMSDAHHRLMPPPYGGGGIIKLSTWHRYHMHVKLFLASATTDCRRHLRPHFIVSIYRHIHFDFLNICSVQGYYAPAPNRQRH